MALAHVQRLLALDDLWTAHLHAVKGGDITDPQLEELRHLADQIAEALGQVPGVADNVVEALATAGGAHLEEALELFARSQPFRRRLVHARDFLQEGEPLRRRLVQAVYAVSGGRVGISDPLDLLAGGAEDNVSPRETLIFACRVVRDETDEERAHLQSKIDLLKAEHVPEPDLRPHYRCGINLLGIGAGAVATIGTAGAVELAPLGVVSQVTNLALNWEMSGCSNSWRTVKARFAR